jgi:hypothetical protein
VRWTKGTGVIFASESFHETYGAIDLPTGRNDAAFIKSNGKRKAFLKGGNLSCRFHIHQHYNIYKERCEKVDIPVNHWAIPWPTWNMMEAAKEAEKRGQSMKKEMQQKLDFKHLYKPFLYISKR